MTTGRQKQRKDGILMLVIGYPIVVWAALMAAPYLKEGLFVLLQNIPRIFSEHANILWTADSLKAVFLFSGIYTLIGCICITSTKNYRRQEEHGSAKWGNIGRVNREYRFRKMMQNRILTQNVAIGLDGQKHKRNLNTLIVGGSGSGKTRFYAKPNLMQANTSYVILDPKAELIRSTGHLLEAKGYEIKVFDLIHMERSDCYNPFQYLNSDQDVLRLVTNLIRNTTPKNSTNNDPFWEKSEIALLEALIFYLIHEAPEEEQNFGMVMDMLMSADAREDDEDYESPLDILFSRLELREPEHIAVRTYNIFKLAAGKTAKSILVSLGVRIEKFNLDSLREITNFDEMDFERIGEKKTALFAVIPDNDSSFNFIIGMLYTQLFQTLYEKADNVYGGRLPIHVHFLMDEFANLALPDEFDKLLSTMRSREISVSIIIQNMAQLKALFKDSWESLAGNCDEFLYLGGNEQATHEYISKQLGKETLDTNTYGRTRGRSGSYSTNYQQTGRELLTPDEVRLIDNKYALLFIRGERPVMDLKYDLMKHPNIRHTSDGGLAMYEHGVTQYELDFNKIVLDENAEYELLSEEELEALFLTEGKDNEQ